VYYSNSTNQIDKHAQLEVTTVVTQQMNQAHQTLLWMLHCWQCMQLT